MPKGGEKNKYCRVSDLTNEASVESFFILRLLADLGYNDDEIKTKHSIQELKVARGRSRESYRPDFVLVCADKPRWLIDAKATDEKVEDFTYQGAGYSLAINRKHRDRPVKYYLITNGLLTRVYVWDQQEAILSLRFADFRDGNTKFSAFKELLAAETARKGWQTASDTSPGHRLRRPSMDEVKKSFLRCHKIIWKAEKMSPQAAFVEFAKLLFVKLWEDRRLRDNADFLTRITKGEPVPADAVRFSSRWTAEQEHNSPNPVGDILFRQLVEFLEEEIAERKRKRIFQPDEQLGLSAPTVKRVVEELEGYYLFGIDEDLNGRMFEAFLTATMRGQALGQYFTPRSIVKLMTRLANPIATRGQIERVLDACCGTGGFLIEVLTEMRRQVYGNPSLTKAERERFLDEVANEAIFGIDAGREPPITRIARINMYLHGDGGSRIYMTDGLRRLPEPSGADPVEVRHEVAELRGLLEKGTQFDVVLTNPPFSMDYAATVPEEREILETYELATYGGKRRASLRSSVMFLERYWRLLKPGGRLLTVIDDSVLSGKNYDFVRDFIRERFVIRAVISLHGDAFQRAGARAKTSIIYLEKRDPGSTQPDAFVYESRYIGLDDVVPRTPPSVADRARESALEEMENILELFKHYMQGSDASWTVASERLTGRLDAKFLRPWSVRELEDEWKRAGARPVLLSDLVEPVWSPITLVPEEEYTFLRINYEGYAEPGETRLGREVTYSKISTAREGDIVVSNISAVYRAICVLPAEMERALISTEFTILGLKDGVEVDPMYLWSVLRSSAVIAEWLSGASGVGRHRVDWNLLKDQLIPVVPYPDQKKVGDYYRSVIAYQKSIQEHRVAALDLIAPLGLEGDSAKDRLARAKPPR